MSAPLKLAVPRGSLYGGTLDLLDAIGVDTAEARSDSRALTFDAGELMLVTMRPSDVPTYVEAGAADLGITGQGRAAGAGRPGRLRAARPSLRRLPDGARLAGAGDERLSEAQRRLGAMRIATKYPRIAERYFEDTGRQAEVIEVKGSVELAPLVGPGRRHRRPRRHRPHPGRERPRGARGDRAVHRAPRREPGRAQAPGGRDRRARRAPAGGERHEGEAAGVERHQPARPRGRPARPGAPTSRSPAGSARSSSGCGAEETPPSASRRSASASRRPSRFASTRRRWRPPRGCWSPTSARRCGSPP